TPPGRRAGSGLAPRARCPAAGRTRATTPSPVPPGPVVARATGRRPEARRAGRHAAPRPGRDPASSPTGARDEDAIASPDPVAAPRGAAARTAARPPGSRGGVGHPAPHDPHGRVRAARL